MVELCLKVVVDYYFSSCYYMRVNPSNSLCFTSNLILVALLQHPSGGFIHPSGEELSLYDSIDKLKKCYGDRQGTKYRVWIDRLLPTRISNDAWLVRFDKWETSGKTFK